MTEKNMQRQQLSGEPEKITPTFLREVSAKYKGPRRKPFQILIPCDVKEFLNSIVDNDAREHFCALFLDGSNQVVSYATVSIGSANSTIVHPREVFQLAILTGAVAIIVAHNHPSGKVEPSIEDFKVTQILKEAGDVIGIRLLDHVIFSSDSFYSFSDEGRIA